MAIKRWLYEIPYLMLATLIISYLCLHTPSLDNDIDPSYITFGGVRPPLYPAFIWLFHWARSYQFILLIWAQGALLFMSLLYARHWLKKYLQIADAAIFLICLWVVLTITLHFQIGGIQPAGVSFPSFILAFFLLIECFQKFSLKKTSYLALLVSILVLTRLQFYYFYIIFLILCLWYLWQKIPIKQVSFAFLVLFGSAASTTLIDHSYHYFKHGTFSGAPYGGLLILVQALYLAEDNAANYFQNPAEKAYVQSMINQRNAQHLNKDAHLIKQLKPRYFEYAYQSYARNYTALQIIVEKTLNTSIENTFGKTNFKANTIAFDIDKTLILNEFKKNILFFLWKIIQCMESIPQFLFFSLLLVAVPFKIIKNKIREPDISLLFVGTITVITFLNAAIVAASNPYISLYFCYSQFMFYCLAAFLASRTWMNYVKKKMDT